MTALLLQQLRDTMQAAGVYHHGSVCAEPTFGTDMQAWPDKSHQRKPGRTDSRDCSRRAGHNFPQQGEELDRPRDPVINTTRITPHSNPPIGVAYHVTLVKQRTRPPGGKGHTNLEPTHLQSASCV